MENIKPYVEAFSMLSDTKVNSALEFFTKLMRKNIEYLLTSARNERDLGYVQGQIALLENLRNFPEDCKLTADRMNSRDRPSEDSNSTI